MTVTEQLKRMDEIGLENDERWERFTEAQRQKKTA